MYECMPEIKTSMLGLSFSFLCPFNHSLTCIQKSSLWILEWLNARIVSFPNELRSHTALLNNGRVNRLGLLSHLKRKWKGLTNQIPSTAHTVNILKTESIGKLSNFNFQWTKNLYQIYFRLYQILFYTLEGYRYN